MSARCCMFAVAVALASVAGCLHVETPREINVGYGRPRVDASRVPETSSHEEARQKLAEAYAEIRYLNGKVDDLEADKRKLKSEREEYKDKYEDYKKRYERARGD